MDPQTAFADAIARARQNPIRVNQPDQCSVGDGISSGQRPLDAGPNNYGISTIPGDDEITLTEKDFSKLSMIIGKNWKHLGRQLGLEEVKITHIDMNTNNYEVEEKIYQMFMKWGKQCPQNNSLGTVIKAIHECPKLGVDLKQYEEFVSSKRNV